MNRISSIASRGLVAGGLAAGLSLALACSPALAAKSKPNGPKVVPITIPLSVVPTVPED